MAVERINTKTLKESSAGKARRASAILVACRIRKSVFYLGELLNGISGNLVNVALGNELNLIREVRGFSKGTAMFWRGVGMTLTLTILLSTGMPLPILFIPPKFLSVFTISLFTAAGLVISFNGGRHPALRGTPNPIELCNLKGNT